MMKGTKQYAAILPATSMLTVHYIINTSFKAWFHRH